MPIDKVSAAQYATDIAAGVNSRAPSFDTAYGPIPDTCIQPQSKVLESQNDRVRKLSLLLTLANADEFTGFESDLEGIAFNEGVTRTLGSTATATLIFSRTTAPTSDAPVQRGFPVGTQADESTGEVITFLTTEARTMLASAASSYFNIETQKYELSVPATAVVSGSAARVASNRINRPLRPLGAFDTVTNPDPATGGRDQETNAELIERYLTSIIGRQTGVALGIERVARADYPDLEDVAIVYGANVLLERAATDAGAVDAWVKGELVLQAVENQTFLGTGQLMLVASPPLVSVVSVASGATTYIEGSDYEVELDTTGVSRSTRGQDGIRFLVGGPSALPAVGAVVTITYKYNNLIRALQAGFEQDDTLELGRDLLFREGTQIDIVHTANLRVVAGFNTTAVLTAVQNAVLAFVNSLELGDDVEGSDIQGTVRQISGVDNYVITRLTRSTVLSGTADVVLGENEYPALSTANLVITLI